MPEQICRDYFEEDFLQNQLMKLVKSLNVIRPKFRVSLASDKADNFVGCVYRVVVSDENNGKECSRRSFIFKAPSRDWSRRRFMQSSLLFARETLFYETVVPIFEDLLKERGKSLDFVPKYYGGSTVENEETIILEDLSTRGFVLRDRLRQLDHAHASLAVRYLGRLHAISFALRDQRPDEFRIFSGMREDVFRKECLETEGYRNREKVFAQCVRTVLQDEDPYYTERFEEFLKDSVEKVQLCCRAETAEPYSALNHGDCWSNNLLFKYNEATNEPTAMYFVDFQVSRYVSPALDIHYLLYCSCNQKLRSAYYDKLIEEYYDSFSKYLRELGSDPNKLFPMEALQEQLKKFGTFAGVACLILIHMFTFGRRDVPNVDASNDDVKCLQERLKKDHFYRETLHDCFKDLIDRNYI
ncbi:uncharacterized protein LOC107274586 [Cephus cinctus]|uniref:Uncharacterized protein LOC107274586 n=1 Tax=Cephus cinctus TaxID=211228 RepID=A0AAJ7FUS5_CEPCN|nr:uncharacterized protein LOC107274586 [Cephus cinctus]